MKDFHFQILKKFSFNSQFLFIIFQVISGIISDFEQLN